MPENMSTSQDRVCDERNTLERLLTDDGYEVIDAGYDFTNGVADLVYEFGGRRYEITVTEVGE